MARVAIPIADEFEDSELQVPMDALRDAGHEVTLIGFRAGQQVHGKRHEVVGTVDVSPASARPDDFDALVIPGGHSPDALRMDDDIVDFVRRFAETGRPIAAVCHGPQLLIEADLVRDRIMTSWPSVRKDLENAGATWVDREVVEDGQFITSRRPDDLEAFSQAILRSLADKPAEPSQR